MSSDQLAQLELERKLKIEKENKKKEEEALRQKQDEERRKEAERKKIQEEDLYAAHDFDINIDFGPVMSAPTPTAPSRPTTTPVVNGSHSSGTPKRLINLETYKKKKGLI